MTECVPLDTDSGPVRLAWQVEQPEEDPGYVYLLADRGGESHLVGWGGDLITGDPRALDLGVSVEQLLAILTDPGFRDGDLAQALVAAGEACLLRGSALGARPPDRADDAGALAGAVEGVRRRTCRRRDVSLPGWTIGAPLRCSRYGRGRRLVLGVVPSRLDPDGCRTADEMRRAEATASGWAGRSITALGTPDTSWSRASRHDGPGSCSGSSRASPATRAAGRWRAGSPSSRCCCRTRASTC
ncbi:MAG: hypothetical protein R2734_20305 [Nocardioides sp.]